MNQQDSQAQALALAAQVGDREAFDQLVLMYQRQLFGLTLMMLRDQQGAEEVTQDAFMRAYTNLDLYNTQRPFYPWLAKIAVRLGQNWLYKSRLNTNREGTALADVDEPASPKNQLVALMADEKAQQLWRSVAALPSGERTATFLFYRQEMKVEDIARALGVTSGTVKTLLFRARKKLRTAQTPKEQQS